MNTTLKHVLAAAILIPAIASSATAQAKIKEVKFHQVMSQFEDVPYMNMEFKNGKWQWTSKSKSFNTRIKVYFKASRKIRAASIHLRDTGHGLWTLPAGYETKKYEKLNTVTVGKSFLSPLQAKAAAVCDVFGGSKKVVRDMNFTMTMSLTENEPGTSASKNGTYTVRAICQPKPSDPQRQPADMRISQIKLYTIPKQPVCGKPVKLVSEIWTNRPGEVAFVLERNDGATQKASVVTTKVTSGFVKRWAKTYTFDKSVDRRYRIVGQKQAITSPWVEMKLNCGVGADVGVGPSLTN